MSETWQMIVTVVCSVIASSGFWAFVQNRRDKRNFNSKLLLGLAHDRIMYLGMQYIERGYITRDEYENFYHYLYNPYEKSGGNGSAKRLKLEVDKLPIRNAIKEDERDAV